MLMHPYGELQLNYIFVFFLFFLIKSCNNVKQDKPQLINGVQIDILVEV